MMIGKMNEKANGIGFKIIFTLVSLSFVLGGIGAGTSFFGAKNFAAKVNGEEISQQAFNVAKGRQQNVLNAQMGAAYWDLMDNPAYSRQFHEAVLNSLIDDELFRQYASELKLGISADQIKAEIVNSPAFQQDGKFSNTLYQQTLRNNNLNADNYAAIVHEGLLFGQIEEGVLSSNFSVPAQQSRLAELLLQKRQIRVATYPIAEEMAIQTATESELQAYYDTNKTELINPEKLTVEYVELSPKEIEQHIQVTDEQIENYYNTNRANYVTQGETQLAHIQVATEAEANKIAQALQKGEDFATLAKAKSADKLSANQGGDLGWAKAGTFPPVFENTANALQVDQVSQPVAVDGNFHIIKVLARKEGREVPLAQVKSAISETIRAALAMTEYSNTLREMANTAFENPNSLEKVAEVAKVTLHQTQEFTRENTPEALNHEGIIKALFTGELRQSGQNSEGIEIGDQHQSKTIFVRVAQYQAESTQSFEQAKNAVEQAVKRQKAQQVLAEKTTTLVKSLDAGEAISVPFSLTQELIFAQAQATQAVLAQQVFAMAKPESKTVYHNATLANGDVAIIALDKVTDGTLDEFKPFAAQFAQADQLVLRQDLLRDLREKAKIEYNQDFLEQLEGNGKP